MCFSENFTTTLLYDRSISRIANVKGYRYDPPPTISLVLIHLTGQSLRDLCQFLIKVVPCCPQVILKYFLELQTIVMRHIGQPVDDENDTILAKLCAVLLSIDDEPCLKLAADVVEHLMSNKRLWPCYKIGCVAANNSRHEMANSIFSQLTQVVSTSAIVWQHIHVTNDRYS